MGLVDQQDRVRAGEQNAGIELQGLRFRFDELDAAAFSWAIQLRLTADVLVELAISTLPLIKAIAQPIFRLPSDEARYDVHVGRLAITHLQPVALLDGPAVARLAPFIVHRAARIDHTRVVSGGTQSHRIERPVRRDLGGASRCRRRCDKPRHQDKRYDGPIDHGHNTPRSVPRDKSARDQPAHNKQFSFLTIPVQSSTSPRPEILDQTRDGARPRGQRFALLEGGKSSLMWSSLR